MLPDRFFYPYIFMYEYAVKLENSRRSVEREIVELEIVRARPEYEAIVHTACRYMAE